MANIPIPDKKATVHNKAALMDSFCSNLNPFKIEVRPFNYKAYSSSLQKNRPVLRSSGIRRSLRMPEKTI